MQAWVSEVLGEMRSSGKSKPETALLRGEQGRKSRRKARERTVSEMWEQQEKVRLRTPERREFQEKRNDQQ